MKISELNQWDRETLEFDARSFLDDHNHQIHEFKARHYHALRCSGYAIGPDSEVYKYDSHGMLRECANGIPCRHWCQGAASGKCTQIPTPEDGCPTGRLTHEQRDFLIAKKAAEDQEKRLLVAQKDAQASMGKEAQQQAGILPLPEETRDSGSA